MAAARRAVDLLVRGLRDRAASAVRAGAQRPAATGDSSSTTDSTIRSPPGRPALRSAIATAHCAARPPLAVASRPRRRRPGPRARRPRLAPGGHRVHVAAQEQAAAAARPGEARDEVVAAAVVAAAPRTGWRRRAGCRAQEAGRRSAPAVPPAPVSRARPAGPPPCRRREGQDLLAERPQEPPRRVRVSAWRPPGSRTRARAGPRRRRCARAKAASEAGLASGWIVCGDVTAKEASRTPRSRALSNGRGAPFRGLGTRSDEGRTGGEAGERAAEEGVAGAGMLATGTAGVWLHRPASSPADDRPSRSLESAVRSSARLSASRTSPGQGLARERLRLVCVLRARRSMSARRPAARAGDVGRRGDAESAPAGRRVAAGRDACRAGPQQRRRDGAHVEERARAPSVLGRSVAAAESLVVMFPPTRPEAAWARSPGRPSRSARPGGARRRGADGLVRTDRADGEDVDAARRRGAPPRSARRCGACSSRARRGGAPGGSRRARGRGRPREPRADPPAPDEPLVPRERPVGVRRRTAPLRVLRDRVPGRIRDVAVTRASGCRCRSVIGYSASVPRRGRPAARASTHPCR